MSDRSVHTDALATLGTIITPSESRDAIHLAVLPTCATEVLRPGQDVGVSGKFSTSNNPVGVVDPFLKTQVLIGEWFWLILYPRTITSLRHVWTHDSVPDDAEYISTEAEEPLVANQVSIQFVETAAANLGISLDELMDMCDDYIAFGNMPVFNHDLDYDIDPTVVLMHYGIIKGIVPTYEQRENFYFRCAC